MQQDSATPTDDSAGGSHKDRNSPTGTNDQTSGGSADGHKQPESDSTNDPERVTTAAPSLFTRFRDRWHEIFARFLAGFGLQKWDLLPVIVVALLVGSWIYVRGRLDYEDALLGRPLRVGIVSWPGYAGGLVANNGLEPNKDSNFWKPYKLLVKFELVEDEAELRRKFEDGEIDIMWSTVDSLTQQPPDFRRVQPRAIMQVDWSRGGDAIVVTPGIERIEQLKGKRIAVSMAASKWLLENGLKNSSLTDDDRATITEVETKGSQEAAKLFDEGRVDAAVIWEPDVTQTLNAKKGSSNILIDTSTATDLIADVMVAREQFIQQHPDVIDAFIKGWFDGTARANADPMLAVKVLQAEQKFAELGEDETQKVIKKVVWATLEDNAGMFGLAGGKIAFDDLFHWASRLKQRDGAEPLSAEQARDIERLEKIYKEQYPKPNQGCGTKPPVATIPLAIPFAPGRAEISDEARNVLDNQEALFILQTYTGARFCVRACPDEGDCDPQRAADDVSRSREKVVINYLVEHYYNRPRSQFVSASEPLLESPNTGAEPLYIRLNLLGTGSRR